MTFFLGGGGLAAARERFFESKWSSKHQRSGIIGHGTNHGRWSSWEAGGFGIEIGILRVDTRGSEESTIDKNVTCTSPVPWLPTSYTWASIILDPLGDLLEVFRAWRFVVVSLAVDSGILTPAHRIDAPWKVVIVHHMEVPISASAERIPQSAEHISDPRHQQHLLSRTTKG